MLRHCHWRDDSGGSDQGSIAASASPATTMASTAFSLFFPLHTAQWPPTATATAGDALDDDHSSVTTSPSSPSSSSTGSVDCTLSLGTPSSRRAEPRNKRAAHQAPRPSATVSWDDVAAANQSQYYRSSGSKPAAKGAGVARADHDQLMLVDRRCANCGTSSTPLWRNGPRGPKSLCNACGIRFKKEERRAAATAAAMDQAAGCGYIAQRYGPPAPAPCCEGAFPCGGGDVTDAAAEAPPLLAWRLNVVAPAPATSPATFAVWPPERSSLFQYN